MNQQSTPSPLNELTDIQLNEPANFPPNESANPQHLEKSARGYITPPDYIPESILGIITEYYEGQLAIKESEIGALSNELSQIKKVSQQQNHEPEQIKSQYKEEIAKIPEVQQALYKQNQREIQFLVVLDNMRWDLSDQLGEIEDHLEASFTSWLFDFEHIGHRISSQQHQNAYIEFFTRD